MSHPDINNDNNKIFNMNVINEKTQNHRTAVRYIREDITISLQKFGLLSSSKKIPAKLLDISSKGATIECEMDLGKNEKIILDLFFKDNKEFSIHAKTIHQVKNKNQYGIKFDIFHHKLGDYILSSQQELIFK